MATNEDERAQLIALLRALLGPLLVDPVASRMSLPALRATIAGIHAQHAHYRAHGFVDEAGGA